MNILIMGGTRFVGKSLVEKLLSQNHEIVIFTRGNNPLPENVDYLRGDRNQIENILKLKDKTFDIIFDISGRELKQTKLLLNNIKTSFARYIYVSSAGVYKDTHEFPKTEKDAIDINSRHKGKFETEDWLVNENIPFTSFRPTYIYGPNNYNKIENWFFERIYHLKKIPIPGDGSLITQLGHVSDLTDAMILSMSNENAKNNIFNCSGNKTTTIKDLIYKCIETCSLDKNDIELIPFDYKKLDPKSRKSFPIRLSNYQTSIRKIKSCLDWEPKYDLSKGLKNSFENDFKFKISSEFDFASDSSLFI